MKVLIMHVDDLPPHGRRWWVMDEKGDRLLKVKARGRQAAARKWAEKFVAKVTEIGFYKGIMRASEAAMSVVDLRPRPEPEK